MLSQAEIEEIVAYDRKHRRKRDNGRLWRGTERYNYLRQTGGEPGARDWRKRPDIEILHVAVRLDMGYSPFVKVVAIFRPSLYSMELGDIRCAGAAGWIVTWQGKEIDNKLPHPPQEGVQTTRWWRGHLGAGSPAGFDWRGIVNRSVLKGSRFEYSGFEEDQCDIIGHLRITAQYPEVEHLKKAKLQSFIAPSILQACRRDRKLYEKAMARAAEFRRETSPRVILWALRHDKSIRETNKYFEFVDEWSQEGRHTFPLGLGYLKMDYERLQKSARKWDVRASEYWRYLHYANECGLDLGCEGVKHPPVGGGRKAFMARLEALEAEVARRAEEQRRKEREAYEKRMAKLQETRMPELERIRRLMRTRAGGLELVLPTSQQELHQLGKRMHNCVGNGSYWQEVMEGRCLILEIREKKESAYCVEITRPHFAVLQCYGRRNSKAPDEIRELAREMAAEFKSILKPNTRKASA